MFGGCRVCGCHIWQVVCVCELPYLASGRYVGCHVWQVSWIVWLANAVSVNECLGCQERRRPRTSTPKKIITTRLWQIKHHMLTF